MTGETEQANNGENIPTVVTPKSELEDTNGAGDVGSVKSGDEDGDLDQLKEEDEPIPGQEGVVLSDDAKALKDELDKIKVDVPTMIVYGYHNKL